MLRILKLIVVLPRLKKAIIKCFNGVSWEKNTFINDGVMMENHRGEKQFYSAEEVDKGIRKLNRILKLL